jgi:hypothetical protein
VRDEAARHDAALGALAGLCATLVMTSAMERMHQRLPVGERYPLTPREITESVAPLRGERALTTATLYAHFAYGAATGAIYGAVAPRGGVVSGMLFGIGVWLASYLGWIPALRILKPAADHPPRRNALMLTAHMLWGASTALALRELTRVRRGALAAGALRDLAKGRVRPRR